jgi:hypothetical protein
VYHAGLTGHQSERGVGEQGVYGLTRRLPAAGAPGAAAPTVIALEDDWNTQGSWVDRHGTFKAILSAMNGGGFDAIGGYRGAWVGYRPWIGRNGAQGDYLRYYVTWIHSDDPRVAQNVIHAGRKQAEWDDHGETKPMTIAGPNVYCTVRPPRGRYILSCYFFNKDGHLGPNRWRDFVVQVKPAHFTHEQFSGLDSIRRSPRRPLTGQPWKRTRGYSSSGKVYGSGST